MLFPIVNIGKTTMGYILVEVKSEERCSAREVICSGDGPCAVSGICREFIHYPSLAMR
jgi:hypothetical protein